MRFSAAVFFISVFSCFCGPPLLCQSMTGELDKTSMQLWGIIITPALFHYYYYYLPPPTHIFSPGPFGRCVAAKHKQSGESSKIKACLSVPETWNSVMRQHCPFCPPCTSYPNFVVCLWCFKWWSDRGCFGLAVLNCCQGSLKERYLGKGNVNWLGLIGIRECLFKGLDFCTVPNHEQSRRGLAELIRWKVLEFQEGTVGGIPPFFFPPRPLSAKIKLHPL